MTMTSTNTLLDSLAVLDYRIEKLQDDREVMIAILEKTADAWDKQGGRSLLNPGCNTRGCSSCSFRYRGLLEQQFVDLAFHGQLFGNEPHLHFSTKCTWCSNDEGAGVDVPVSFVDWFLATRPDKTKEN